MRELIIGSEHDITHDTGSRLSSNSPDGLLFPKLERLEWEVGTSWAPLPFFSIFLSPRLKRVNLYTDSIHFGIPRDFDYVLLVEDVIPCLPTSLEELSLTCGPWKGEPLRNVISSLVRRCGPSLRSFSSNTRLSEKAVYHLSRLPSLRSWTVAGEPPQKFSPATFPALNELRLKQGAIPWLHLLAACGG